MKAFRYNTKKREDRAYNNCGEEKNPNNIKFYATNMNYADNYKYIYNEDGDVVSECSLEVIEIENVNLFDMAVEFKTLDTYKKYIDAEIGAQLRDYTKYLNEAKTKAKKAIWEKNIKDLENREEELIAILFNQEFQPLSDFALQNDLVFELKNNGFDGYITKNEVAVF
jgi:hypothetical protein